MSVRVRFAPSPTGTLHIGGVRTALYNYLLARQLGGQFILRIEDTDQTRYVPGAEAYIIESLRWVGLIPDEGVGFGGDYGPYRQSDRKELYQQHAQILVERGHAYYAFDTPEDLDAQRAATDNFIYNHTTRMQLRNSLSLPPDDVRQLLASGVPGVIRLKVEPGQEVVVDDLIRDRVVFQSSELDDKVLLKADGMPTYHLANIVDDYLMKITHVIRGEEWLSSTAHHVLLYKGFGWEAQMPRFAHLPLIMKPVGNGKLSKRDGAKFGFPVFPLTWEGASIDDKAPGFRETGFLPEAVVNFLALLGWHPESDQEIFSMEALIKTFSIEKITKGGARFDYDKAKWFNQKYIQQMDATALVALIKPYAAVKNYAVSDAFLGQVAHLMKGRVTFVADFVEEGYYFFEPVRTFDTDTLAKKWRPDLMPVLEGLVEALKSADSAASPAELEATAKTYMTEAGAKPGDVMPLLRIALAGTMKGPGVFDMIAALGFDETYRRIQRLIDLAGSLE
jgi:glutamyl-tRNA synthetase